MTTGSAMLLPVVMSTMWSMRIGQPKRYRERRTVGGSSVTVVSQGRYVSLQNAGP